MVDWCCNQKGMGQSMKTIVAVAAVLIVAVSGASAQGLYGNNYGAGLYGTGSNSSNHYVQPHSNSNGTYTQGHYQTSPNSTQFDNYSTRGNIDPYTGAVGTRTPRY